jgi:hypothetical protein
LKFVDPTNTTSTAQYAAAAANSSCLFALVSKDMAAVNKSVNTINTPIAANTHFVVLKVESRYIAKTGATRSKKIATVMNRLTSVDTLEGAK